MTDELVTRYKFAQLVGCSRQHISNLVQKGVLPDLPNKKIPLQSGMEAFKYSSTKQMEKHSPPPSKPQSEHHAFEIDGFDGDLTVRGNQYLAGLTTYAGVETAELQIRSEQYCFGLVKDTDLAPSLEFYRGVDGFNELVFLITESELIEFLKTKKKY